MSEKELALLRQVLESPTNHKGSRSVHDPDVPGGIKVVRYQAKRLPQTLLDEIRQHLIEKSEA